MAARRVGSRGVELWEPLGFHGSFKRFRLPGGRAGQFRVVGSNRRERWLHLRRLILAQLPPQAANLLEPAQGRFQVAGQIGGAGWLAFGAAACLSGADRVIGFAASRGRPYGRTGPLGGQLPGCSLGAPRV